MDQPEVEFFTEDVDGVDYLNVGFKFMGADGEVKRAVLGAFSGDLDNDAMTIIKGLVEEASLFIINEYSVHVKPEPSKLIIPSLEAV